MNEIDGIRKELRVILGREVPDGVWEDPDTRDIAREYLGAKSDEEREDAWGALEDAVQRALRFWDGGRKEKEGELSRHVGSGARSTSQDMSEAEQRDSGGRGALDSRALIGDRTRAMTEAMSALFALIGDQMPEVKDFRDNVLLGRLLAADEAHALIASCAARTFDRSWFEDLGVPFVGHRAKILQEGPRGTPFSPVDDSMTIRVDPPGIAKTVRYAYPKEGDVLTRCVTRSGAVVPIHTDLSIEFHGDYVYASWLWPGSVVDELYDLSVELAGAFDWPGASSGNLGGTRPLSRAAVWFILTGEVPQVRPIEARWEPIGGSIHLNPQWRTRLTIPPWLPEEEALRALRLLRRQMPKGRQLPKEARTLEVARFVWEQERLNGYQEPAS